MATPESPATVTSVGLLHGAASNASAYLSQPTPKDLALALPRLMSRLATMVSRNPGGGKEAYNASGNATGAAVPLAGDAVRSSDAAGFFSAFSMQQLRTFGGIFSYLTSKWALGCFAAAVLLNRTTIYAASRRNLRLGWRLRLALRIAPLLVLLSLCGALLRTLRCQTSPDYSLMKTGMAGSAEILDFAEDGGFLYWLSSLALFWESEQASCRAVRMIPMTEDSGEALRGSMGLMWTAFVAFNLSQFVETLSCAVQGRQAATETGMSLFELSLAFAEAEAIVGSHVAMSVSHSPKSDDTTTSLMSRLAPPGMLGNYLPLRGAAFAAHNTSPEILLMALVSTLNHLTSQSLGALGLQARYRLPNTAMWGLCFMAAFIGRFLSFSADQGVEASILRFPTVCVVGFVPHTLVLLGILLCGAIYALAVLLAVLAPPAGVLAGQSWRERFRAAHGNMQAHGQLSGLRLRWHEDFYTALLRVGLGALTAASDAVFLNEGRRILVMQWTWLEEERLTELLQARSSGTNSSDDPDSVAEGVDLSPAVETETGDGAAPRKWQSGYARERNTQALKGRPSAMAARGQDGVGAMQRGGRYVLALGFLLKIARLTAEWIAIAAVRGLAGCGMTYASTLLSEATKRHFQVKGRKKGEEGERPGSGAWEPGKPGLQFWALDEAGQLVMPNESTDVETETRRRIAEAAQSWGPEQEAQLDQTLYQWWKSGGWWGERDTSDDFVGPSADDDDDATSVISTATSTAGTDAGSDDSGRRTPTQRDFRRGSTPFSHEPTPFTRTSTPSTPSDDLPLDPSALARLLAPPNVEARQDARRLAAHLSTPHTLTRAQYRRAAAARDTHVLTSSRIFRPRNRRGSTPHPTGTAGSADAPPGERPLSPTEETDVLEQLIVGARAKGGRARGRASAAAQPWSEGAGGMGAGGPVCVVCQSEPRTVLAWPCRCLSLCEDCRVSLAMNNFGSCVCCRQEVVGFSRLFVP